jgi:hypothetical protein
VCCGSSNPAVPECISLAVVAINRRVAARSASSEKRYVNRRRRFAGWSFLVGGKMARIRTVREAAARIRSNGTGMTD